MAGMEYNKLAPREGEFTEAITQCNTELKKELDLIVKQHKLKSKLGVICEMLAVGVHKDF